jgi:hypothetical protein
MKLLHVLLELPKLLLRIDPPPPPQTMRPIISTKEQETAMLGDSAENRANEVTKQRKKAKSNKARKRGGSTNALMQSRTMLYGVRRHALH